MIGRCFVILVVVSVLMGGSVIAGEFYILNGLPEGVSADGALVSGTSGSQYFLWTENGGITLIGGAAAGNGVGGQPKISPDGGRVAGTYLNPISGRHEMSYYDVGSATWNPLGGIGGQSGTEISSGWDISGDGQHVVGLGWVAAPQTGAHAIQWTDGGSVVDLGSTVAGRSSRANAVDFDGNVVAGWQDSSSGFRQGAVWNNGVQTLVTNSAGGAMLGEVSDVSDDGQFAVGIGGSGNGSQPYRWSQATGGVSLGNIFNPSWQGFGTAISSDGLTALGFYRPFGQFPQSGSGFLWTEAGGMQDLTALAAGLGIDLQNTTLALPLAISADGKTIVGLGRQGAVFGVGFILQLESDGDFDNDGDYACADIDLLVGEIAAGTNNALYDMTGDRLVNSDDLTDWLAEAGAAEIPNGHPYQVGDADLNGSVDGTDFIAWNANKFTNTTAWCGGNFNADGFVDGLDFVLWNENKFTSADGATAVPEPGCLALLSITLIIFGLREERMAS